MSDLRDMPQRRFNPLTRQWVLVSPHRGQRPWLGQVEEPPAAAPPYDPTCYLCPGNERAGGVRNPPYEGTFVFDNDFPALLSGGPAENDCPGTHQSGVDPSSHDLLVAHPERGVCRVVCFTPRHDLTLATMASRDVRRVVDTWCEEYARLGALSYISHVQIFQNRGAMMGASNPHPHGQIWATESVPSEPAAEQASLLSYRADHDACLLCRYEALESRERARDVVGNEHFLAVVPFWAVWPFETTVLARRHVRHVLELAEEERDALAEVLTRVAVRYDNLFQASFPYSFGIHQAPTDGLPHEEWHLHMHFYPPLLRSATVRKFLVGFELLGQPQRDLTAETAAERLRALSETHWTSRSQD